MRLFFSLLFFILCVSCRNDTSKGSPIASASVTDTIYSTAAPQAYPIDTSPNLRIFQKKFEIAEKTGNEFSLKVVAIAKDFIGTPYQSGTLENEGKEHLVINLSAVDCWTFVEYCVAIALTSLAIDSANYEVFEQQLQQLRYRRGVIDGYGSRIHYFEEWMLQQTTNGNFEDITQSLGGIPYTKHISFMTNHPDLYPKLKDAKVLEQIKKVEKNLSKQKYFYLPKEQTFNVNNTILSGDIIAITSRLPDLDCEHEGFVIIRGHRVHLLHASYDYKKVILSENTLVNYTKNKKYQTGFMIVRYKN